MKLLTADDWFQYLDKKQVDIAKRPDIRSQIIRLTESNLPVMFDFRHLSRQLGLDSKILAAMIGGAAKFYRTFEIRQKNGKIRKISAPYDSLKIVQRWILQNILIHLPVSDRAMAYGTGCSILKNSQMHLGANELLKIDIKDFFPAIRLNRVLHVFKMAGYTNRVSYYFAALCCLGGALPQGGVCSPRLSNIICKRLDNRMAGVAKKFKLNYTRYGDDMIFSGGLVPPDVFRLSRQIVARESFELNDAKTKFKKKGYKKVVTGLNVHGAQVTVQKRYKRVLRQDLHYVGKRGVMAHLRYHGEFDPLFLRRLAGRVNFVRSIEPGSSVVKLADKVFSAIGLNAK